MSSDDDIPEPFPLPPDVPVDFGDTTPSPSRPTGPPEADPTGDALARMEGKLDRLTSIATRCFNRLEQLQEVVHGLEEDMGIVRVELPSVQHRLNELERRVQELEDR